MSNFKSYELQDLCDFQNGFAFKNTDYIGKSDKSIEVLRMGYIKRGGGFKEDNSPVFVSDSHHMNIERYRLKKGDIVMAMTDMKNSMAILGYSARVPLSDRFLLNQRVGRIRVIKENIVDELYLYYFLNSPEYIHSLQSKANSGVQVNLGTSTIKQSIIYLPSLNQQRMVAEILGCLDEKIELNTQINQTLEQIAQAIFKSWFIDFDPVKAKAEAKAQGSTDEQANIAAMSVISGKSPDQLNAYKQTNPTDYQQLHQLAQAFPSEFEEIDGVEVPKGWEYAYLKDVCNIVYGKGLPKTKLLPEGYDVFGANGNIGYYSEFMYEKPQVLVGCRGTVGQITMSLPYSFITNNSLIIEYENSPFCLSYLYLYLRNINLKEVSSGSVQPQITIQNMNGVKILKPNDDILSFFSKKIMSIYEYKLKIHFENKSLEKTRDLLLPKLLSGEVGV